MSLILPEDFKTKICIYDLSYPVPEYRFKSMWELIDPFLMAMSKKKQSVEQYRNKRRATKPRKDIAVGKYAECITAMFLHEDNGFVCVRPDFGIRYGQSKGWLCDLPYHEKDNTLNNVHVKSCLQWIKDNHGYSWTFQLDDDIFKNPNSDDVVMFVYIPDLDSRDVRIMASAPWRLIQGILVDPIKEEYIGQKKCINYVDLVRLSQERLVLSDG